MPGKSLDEARRYSRVTPALPAVIRSPGMPDRSGVLHDVSAGGVFVRVPSDGLVRRECDVIILLGSGAEIAVHGRIARREPNGVAVELTEINGIDAHHHLMNLIRYNAPDVRTIERELGLLDRPVRPLQRAAPRNGPEILNWATFDQYTNSDREFARRLLDSVRNGLPRQLKAIQDAVATGNPGEALRAAHSLRTSTAWIGGEEVERCAAMLEERIREDALGDFRLLLEHLNASCARLLERMAASRLRDP